MSKSSNSTRAGGLSTTRSATASGGAFSFNTNANVLSNHMHKMQKGLNAYGKSNGYQRLTGDTIWKEISSPSSYVTSYGISVSSEFTAKGVKLQYQTHIGSTRLPMMDAPDRNKFHQLVNERNSFSNIKDAEKSIQDQIKKINKLDIGIK